MRGMLFFLLAVVSIHAFGDATREAKRKIEGCVEAVDGVLKLGQRYTSEVGAITDACITAVNMPGNGYAYYFQCIKEKGPNATNATAKVRLLDECKRASRTGISQDNQAKATHPLYQPTSLPDCFAKLDATGFNKDALTRYKRLIRSESGEDQLNVCGNYLSCIQQASGQRYSQISTVDNCMENQPGQYGGPSHPVNRQGGGGQFQKPPDK